MTDYSRRSLIAAGAAGGLAVAATARAQGAPLNAAPYDSKAPMNNVGPRDHRTEAINPANSTPTRPITAISAR